ncbi:MAG: family 78 glycoside hydrolase catalytic domain, partial [Fermentimonas sp.]|nr:family 78 glycoside hydrolase catalytic domain [Fermentimonas sp.]
MSKTYKYILLIILLIFSYNLKGKSSFTLVNLQTDYIENPIGVDNPNPRLTWSIENNRQGAKQTAYRLIVGTNREKVNNIGSNTPVSGSFNGISWDTGVVKSDIQLITYAGANLEPFTIYYWKVITWDEEENENSSDIKTFEMGMVDISNWNGNWISDGGDINYKPAPYFRKKFNSKKEIESARAYIAVAGLYELYINGEKIGNQRLDPMYTRFDRRNLYVTHDVTSQIKNGENAIGVILGNGWYNHQSLAVWDFERAPWRNRPAFCLDLRITYTDGSVETIPTDLSWKRSDSPIIFNSIYTAEHYNANLDKEGWSEPVFDDSKWQGVRLRSAPSTNITSQQLRPIRNVQTIPAVDYKKINDSTYFYDFGQNMSGVTKINISGIEGTEVRIKHGERLDENGRIDLSNIDVYYRGDNETDPFQ